MLILLVEIIYAIYVKADICEVYKFSFTFYGMLFMSYLSR